MYIEKERISMIVDKFFILTETVFIMLFMIIHMFDNDIIGHKMRHRFGSLCFIIIIGEFLDFIVWESGAGLMQVPINIMKLMKSIEISLMPIVICYLANAIYDDNSKLVKIFSTIICVINFGIMAINYFYMPLIFEIDETGKYMRLEHVYIYFNVYVVCFIILLFQLYRLTVRNQHENFFSLLIIACFIAVNVLYIIFFQGMQSDWLSISLSFIVIYIYDIDIFLSVDPLTSLLNTRNYRNKIQNISYNTVVIFLDCNKFKFINDNYGHQSGDIALQEYSKAMLETFQHYGWIYRRSGDEFVVIFKPGAIRFLLNFSKNKDLNTEIVKLLEKLDKNIEKRAEEIHYLKLGMSYGYAIYVSRSHTGFVVDTANSANEYSSIDAAIDAADKNTYDRKKQTEPEQLLIEKELPEEEGQKLYKAVVKK